jgi:NAD(P)-dependent dehydrogenase (short-subunit alcohol dehydrogenase family)
VTIEPAFPPLVSRRWHAQVMDPCIRPGQPMALAPVFVFLASQQASYVTGEIYGATGGDGTA